jgi:hypothetical protein
MFKHLQYFPVLSRISHFLYERSEFFLVDSLSSDDLKREIASLAEILRTTFGISDDFFLISSSLNCRIVLNIDEGSFNITNSLFRLSPTVNVLQLTDGNSTRYVLLIPPSPDPFSLLESRPIKVRKINKLMTMLKKILESPSKMASNNLLLKSMRVSAPVIHPNSPIRYNSLKNISTQEIIEIKDLSHIQVPQNPFSNFNIFQKFDPDQVFRVLKEEKYWTRKVKNSDSKILNSGKALEDFSVFNKRELEIQGLEKKNFFYEFPVKKHFEENLKVLKKDLSSDSEEEKVKPKKVERKEPKELKDPKIEKSLPPASKPQEAPSNHDALPCNLCKIHDYFELIEFRCLCIMCFDCYASSYKRKSCIKCSLPLSISDLAKIQEFL